MSERFSSPLEPSKSPENHQNGVHHLSTATSPGEQSTSQPSQATSNGLNVRSCVTCRKRKVKCDKRHPCSNCNKAAIECIFPGPGRAPRKSRKPPDTELLARLRRLEGVVQSLGKGVEEEGEGEGDHEPVTDAVKLEDASPIEVKAQDVKMACGRIMSMHEPSQADKNTNGITNQFGKLVVDERRSRYVSHQFWTSLGEEVAEMQDILDDPTDEEDDYPSPSSMDASATNSQGFLFSFSSTILSLRNFHPAQDQIPTYWELYKSNIDPVMKLLHAPHASEHILTGARNLDHVSRPLELLMFSVYFAVITSMSEEESQLLLGVERSAALRKYRFATEQALARANFINTQDIMVLQAMLLFLNAVRRTDDTRYVWTMAGLLIRLATSLGLHRDGAQYGLAPFSTEMRRRLWWQICILDVRAAEDQGCEPSITESSFDTKFPLNINDSDLERNSTKTPEEHEGATQMTFDLVRYCVSTTVRRLTFLPPGPGPCRTKIESITLEHKEHIIEELHQYVENKYLRHLDMSVPLHWVTATVARLIMAKMWLVVHHPLKRSDVGYGLPEETKDRLFTTSVEVIDFSRLLETEKATRKWGWLFRTYVQWHALAFVLSQLCVRTEGPEVDRAWMAIESVFDDWGGIMSTTQRGMMWKPLRKLMSRARLARTKALQQRALFPLDGSLGPSILTPLVTQPGPTMNGSSTGDYFGLPDSSVTSDDLSNGFMQTALQSRQPDGEMSDFSAEANDANKFIKPDDLSFLGPLQSQANGLNGANAPNQFNGMNMDIWQLGTTQAGGAMGIPPSGVGVDGMPPDMSMTPASLTGWDEMIREFQTQGNEGMLWSGVEI